MVCRRVTVVTLGDLGQSPRTQYHSLALADAGIEVDLVAYPGHAASADVEQHPRIARHFVTPVEHRTRRGWARPIYLALAAVDGGANGARLARTLLFTVPSPDVIVVQSPPAVPTLAISWLVARLRSARLVIDWHNLTHSMLALRVGEKHPATRAVRAYEATMGRLADGHLCVSRAMASYLADRFGCLGAHVLYDRPASMFVPLSEHERTELRECLFSQYDVPVTPAPAFVVSATSWTADEDFALLLDALARYERTSAAPLFVLITGDGPGRGDFEARARALALRKVHVRTAWLPPADYPRVLAAADVGLCLHRSSSGLDLPMKIADMAGVGLPVCALDYGPCLSERMQGGRDGLLFANAGELSDALEKLFGGYPNETALLDRLRAGLARAHATWSEGWLAEARVAFTDLGLRMP